MDAVGRFHNREPRYVACPSGFNPQQFPILAVHYFGAAPIANPDIVYEVTADSFPPAPLRRTAGGST